MRHSVEVTITLHRYPEIEPGENGFYLVGLGIDDVAAWHTRYYRDGRWLLSRQDGMVKFWAKLPTIGDTNVKV